MTDHAYIDAVTDEMVTADPDGLIECDTAEFRCLAMVARNRAMSPADAAAFIVDTLTTPGWR